MSINNNKGENNMAIDQTINQYAYYYYYSQGTINAGRDTDTSYSKSFDYVNNIPSYISGVGSYSSTYGSSYVDYNKLAYNSYTPSPDYQNNLPAYDKNYDYVHNYPEWADQNYLDYYSSHPYAYFTPPIDNTSTGIEYSGLSSSINLSGASDVLISSGVAIVGILMAFLAYKHFKKIFKF